MSASTTIHVVTEIPASLASAVKRISRPPRNSGSPPTANDAITFFGELGVMQCRSELELGICVFRQRPALIDRMEQHEKTQELLYAIDDDFIAAVAPADPATGGPRLSELTAVMVRRGEGLLFQTGAWHWAPFPMKEESFALVGFARGTATKDMIVRELGRTISIAEIASTP